MPDASRRSQRPLDGRVAVVTGGAAGLGRAIAERLADDGAHIAILDRNDAAASDVAAALARGATRALSALCDVSSEADVVSAIAAVRRDLGPIDVLINAAGVVSAPGQPFTDNTEADWDRVLSVNVKGAFFAAKAVVADMKGRRDGRIVNVSSITGIIHAPFIPPYSVSKAALNSLTKVLARQLAPDGITVNAVAPGYIWTDLWDGLGTAIIEKSGQVHGTTPRAVFESRVRELVPMQREQTAEDVAALVGFLVSPAARNITGQIIGVDGGITI